MKGCGHHRGMLDRCRCIGYQPISRPIEDALTELLDAVAECERDWVLMDRIDFALGVSPRRR